jgi:hypothetical protein
MPRSSRRGVPPSRRPCRSCGSAREPGWPGPSDCLPSSVDPGQPRERRTGQPREDPIAAQRSPEVTIDADRRSVPVEYRPLHAAAAPAQCDARQRPQQGPSRAAPTLGGQDEEILEVERGTRQERRVREEVEGEADRPAAPPTDQGLEIAAWTESVASDPGGGGDALVGETLILGETPDQRDNRRNVAPGTATDREPRGGHGQAAATVSSISV